MLAYLVQYLSNKRHLTEEQSENIEIWFKSVKLNPFTNFEDHPEIRDKSTLQLNLKQKDFMSKVVAPKQMLPKLDGDLKTIPVFEELARKTEL